MKIILQINYKLVKLNKIYSPLIILYVKIICVILFAGYVAAKPIAQRIAPNIVTLRYENSLSNGPTKSPEKFIIISRPLIISAAPVVPTWSVSRRSPNNKPNDGSIDLVASCKKC